MLLRGSTELRHAYDGHFALPGFVAYNLETVQAIVMAAERSQSPVLLQAGSSAFRHAGRLLAQLALAAAAGSPAALGVHLDHSRSLDEIGYCLGLGYTSVMVDGSHLSWADNISLTKQAVDMAHGQGAWVEAELGAVPGDEDRSVQAKAAEMTDPGRAAEFVAVTGVDALAVAVGNVHGAAQTATVIDLARLESIHQAVPVPLVLHGASGLAPGVVRSCLTRGVAKVNVNTELRQAFLRAMTDHLPGALPTWDLAGLLGAARDAMAAQALSIIKGLLPGNDQGAPVADHRE